MRRISMHSIRMCRAGARWESEKESFVFACKMQIGIDLAKVIWTLLIIDVCSVEDRCAEEVPEHVITPRRIN